jgi:hypothetical protein
MTEASNGAHHLATHPLHLGLGATAVVEPRFTGAMDWYQAYTAHHAIDGTVGTITLHQESADVTGEAAAVFITAGLGTQHRPR